jgi:hypothetical protein
MANETPPELLEALLRPSRPFTNRRQLREHDHDARRAEQHRQRRFLDALFPDRPSEAHKPPE